MATYTNGVYLTTIEDIGLERRSDYLGQPPKDLEYEELGTAFPTDESIGLDTPIAGGVALYYPNYATATDSVAFDSQYFPRQSSALINQTILKSASGALSIYDSGYSDKVVTMTIKNITEVKRKRLYCLLVNICKGALNTLELWERTKIGSTPAIYYTVRWIDKEFQSYTPFWLKSEIVLHFRKED